MSNTDPESDVPSAPRAGGGGRLGRPGAAGGQGARIWEVFRQERKGQAFEHAGSVDAPDEPFAHAYAHEQFGRRGESVALWIAPRDAISEVEDFVDELGKNYHRVDGYSLKAKLKEARELAAKSAAHFPRGES